MTAREHKAVLTITWIEGESDVAVAIERSPYDTEDGNEPPCHLLMDNVLLPYLARMMTDSGAVLGDVEYEDTSVRH